jgi:hypothetical protein
MKRLFLALSIVLLLVSCMTPQPVTKEEGTYSEVINVPGMQSNDIFIKTNLWFVDAFKSANNVIEFSNEQQGIIKGKYNFETYFNTTPIRVFQTITVEARDERYRITFSDPYFQNSTVTSMSPTINTYPLDKRLLEQTKAQWQSTANSLKNFIISEQGQADW